jgi:hypothetical protein
MSLNPDNSGSGGLPPARCDMCGSPMRLAIIVPHPDKPGRLHVYECTGCGLPIVRYVPSD